MMNGNGECRQQPPKGRFSAQSPLARSEIRQLLGSARHPSDELSKLIEMT